MTKYEKAIYDIVTTSYEHLTVNQVYERLKDSYPKVAPATVYNNLNKLWETGFIRKVSIEGMPDRYDSVQKHDHLVCKQCGKIMDISFEDLTAPLRSQLGEDFLFYDLKVYYLCPECRAAKKRQTR
ncbi:MAG: Fur family transcriptional regulator [Oscillospiraceae bacterium]